MIVSVDGQATSGTKDCIGHSGYIIESLETSPLMKNLKSRYRVHFPRLVRAKQGIAHWGRREGSIHCIYSIILFTLWIPWPNHGFQAGILKNIRIFRY